MKKFERAHIPPEEIERNVAMLTEQWKAGNNELRRSFKNEKGIRDFVIGIIRDEVWMNDKYQVNIRRYDGFVHLSIKRLDKQPVHDWRDLQEIKNQLVGPECEALELYPAESRKVDTANQYHLWAVPDPAFRFDFGFNDGRLVTDEPLGFSVQRPLEEKQSVALPVAA